MRSSDSSAPGASANIAWIAFWLYWLVAASTSNESITGGWRTRLTGISAVGVFVVAGVLRSGSLAVHSVILAAIGLVAYLIYGTHLTSGSKVAASIATTASETIGI